MDEYLYRRMTMGVPGSTGTLSEPKGTPVPRFALQGTVNWMRSLAMLTKDQGIDWSSMQRVYNRVERAKLTDPAVNTVFEQLLMSLHHLAALHAMVKAGSDYNLARVGVMTWYYGIYCATSAMVAAQEGSLQDDHTGTANQWDRQIAAANLAAKPFNLRLNTMVKKDAAIEIEKMCGGIKFSVSNRPTTVDEALGACVSYLSGTRDYREWQITEELKDREKLSDFRTKQAQQLRDGRLRRRTLGFVHQAFRSLPWQSELPRCVVSHL